MSEELNKRVEVQDSPNEAEDYISALNEMKKNTVSKDSYNKLKEENKRLLNSLVSGETMSVEVKPVDVNELRNKLFAEDADLNNVAFIDTALQLRTALMEQGEPDPFLPIGKRISPTEEDISCANRVATVLQECVDYAQGDSAAFTNELQRRTIDTSPMRRR